MREVMITDAGGRLAALVDRGRRERELVYLTRRDHSVAAIVDAPPAPQDAGELADVRAVDEA